MPFNPRENDREYKHEAKQTIIGVLIEEETIFHLLRYAHKYHMPKELLIEMMEYGLFSNQTTQTEQLTIEFKKIFGKLNLLFVYTEI